MQCVWADAIYCVLMMSNILKIRGCKTFNQNNDHLIMSFICNRVDGRVEYRDGLLCAPTHGWFGAVIRLLREHFANHFTFANEKCFRRIALLWRIHNISSAIVVVCVTWMTWQAVKIITHPQTPAFSKFKQFRLKWLMHAHAKSNRMKWRIQKTITVVTES